MNTTLADVLSPVTGCPCDSCPSADRCTEECATFERYILMQSPKKRADVLVDFKASVSKIPGAEKVVKRHKDFYAGYKRSKGSDSQQGWDSVLKYENDFR